MLTYGPLQDEEDAESSASDEDDLPFTRAEALAQVQVPLIIRELVGLRSALSPAQPPPVPPPVPAAIPAIPPWEEGEFPGSHASAFVGARRAAAVGGFPRPSPLRFQTTAPDVESESDDSQSEGDDGADDVASLPELGAPEQIEFQELMRSLRGGESTIPSTRSEFGSSRGIDVSDDDSDEDGPDETELPPLIPDNIGHEYSTTPPATLTGSAGAQSTNTTASVPATQQRFADRLPRLFQGYFQPRPSNLGLHTSPSTLQPASDLENATNNGLAGSHPSLDDVDD